MKILASFFCVLFFHFGMFSQRLEETNKFILEKTVKTTSVKDQYKSSTCWSFSGLAIVESEMLRMGKEEIDLSEMFVARYVYEEKADKFVRLHGELHLGGGGQFHDAMNVIKKYGIVPEEVYGGLCYGENKHVHGELDAAIKGFLGEIVKNPNNKISFAWKKALSGILDAYLGKIPESFAYKGKTYTPKSFTKEVVGINPDDFVEITSFTHHPFYENFAIELQDNWSWDQVYNIPLDEFAQVFDNSIRAGYSIGWGSDVSEKGFAWRNGVATVPETEQTDLKNLEMGKWDGTSEKPKDDSKTGVSEKKITQEIRQQAFDSYQTEDDHGMQIVGIAKNQNGNKFYYVKNSWGLSGNDYQGYFYASEPFVLYKTTVIMVNKNAIPKEIAKKLKL